MRRTVLVALSLTASLLVPGLLLGQVHDFNPNDLVTMKRLSDPQASPDGSQIAFVLRSTDLKANRGRTALWMVGSDGSGARQLTGPEQGNASSPVWAPDGKTIYFLSSRSGSSQIWKIEPSGGPAAQVSHLPLDVSNLKISPDGQLFAFSLRVFPDCATAECTAQKLEARKQDPATGQFYTHLFIRHWDVWEDGRRNHVFVMPVGGGGAVDVMAGMDSNSPSEPFGGPEEFTFTPDGKSIVFSSKDDVPAEPWSTNYDLYVAPVDGSAKPRDLTAANKAWDTQPVFSPDGSTMAYLAMERPGFESDRYRIVLQTWPSGPRRVLTEDWSLSPGSIFFSRDGKTIYATAPDHGNVSLFAVDVATGQATRLVSGGTVRSAQLDGNRLLFGRDTFSHPVDLYSTALDGSGEKELTEVNADKLAGIRFGDFQQFHFFGWNGDTVWGYVIKPADFEPGRKYPVAFLIHGGPQGSWNSEFHYRWNAEVFAGAGFGVVMIDFHGSTGYGQAFTDAISHHWGDRPLEDLKKGLAAAISQYPFLDGADVCALGASYGGFMINWIEGNWPDRFRCLVNHDGVFDQRMMYYSTEELWFPEWEFGGPYWDNPAAYERFNPVNYVKLWHTPMLVIHGGHDYRIPDSQGIGAFTALQRKGIPSEFLFFPDESHFVLKPANSLLWHKKVFEWIEKWASETGMQ
ncbi:MAG TPA: S9 family peptidase [Thermoanaerobaculia bacterium]|nr:S9 family peptidase [Thermoanaerobaculia bacterium]